MFSALTILVAIGLLLGVATPASAYWYLPGIEERSYNRSDPVNIVVNSLRSNTQLTPFDYYHLPFCRPPKTDLRPESLGEILWGDDRETSPYVLSMRQDKKCAVVACASPAKNQQEVKDKADLLRDFIEKDYRAHMSIDNLPGWNSDWWVYDAKCKLNPPYERQGLKRRGYFVGVIASCLGSTLLNNHLHFEVKFHEPYPGKDVYSVVGFNIKPMSIRHANDGGDCNDAFSETANDIEPLKIDDLKSGTAKVVWSYSVKWINMTGNVTWATRWDHYLDSAFANTDVWGHVKYILNAIAITVCLCIIATIILLRMLKKDIHRYNMADPDDVQEEMGWKLVHADVFRPPLHSGVFSALIGSGVQVVLMCTAALFFALLGFLSPANRGGILTTLILIFVLMAFVAGYCTGRLLKMFETREWKFVFVTAMAFPGVVFSVWFVTNLMYWHVDASSAVPFSKFVTLLALWLVITNCLTVLGASFAFHQETITFPVRVGKLAREIPEMQHWWLRPPFIILAPGMLPFGAAFFELRYIFAAVWQGQVYYMFGFLALTFVVWVMTVILVTLITQYYQLTYEDYRWWWRSFAIPSACGVPIILYTFYLFSTQLRISSMLGTWVFFAWMGVFCLTYVLTAGTIGFLAAFTFVRKIYGVIKVD